MSRPGDGEQLGRRWIFAAVGLIMAGVALRVFALDQQGYWHDELYSVAHLSGFDAYVLPSSDLSPFEPPLRAAEWMDMLEADRYWETLDRNLVHEGHPPLYQLGLKGWTSLFGRSIEAVRSFSLLPGVLTIPLIYLVGVRLRGPRLGLAAALLIAVSPFHLYYSVEARNYAWALLFSTLALLAAVELWRNKGSVSKRTWSLWWAGALGACYTHYYAGLYCVVLMALLLGFRRRSLDELLGLGIPFLPFVPWLPVLHAQIDTHSPDHWTVGAPGAVQAALGFADVLVNQLTGVFDSTSRLERVIGATALVLGVSAVVREEPEGDQVADTRWIFISVPVFGLAVLCVDLVTDHHTILITRYLISAVPCLVIICAWLATDARTIHRAALALLIVGNLVGAAATAVGERAAKQMLREAGSYIGSRYSADDLVLVTPSGPTLLGMARYLPGDARVAAAPPNRSVETARRMASDGGTVWLVRQNLGVSYELPDTRLAAPGGEPVTFAGVDVIRITGASGPW